MIGHYIEDDELDAFSLAGLVSGDANLSITTSRSLADISDWVQPEDVDFILLDINRPDTRSLSDDVATIREYSTAPVVFITGDEARFYKERAVVAGAQAVLEKENLSLDSLRGVLATVVTERVKTDTANSDEELLITIPADEPVDTGGGERTDLVINYLRDTLAALADSSADEKSLKSTLALLSTMMVSFRSHFAPLHQHPDSPYLATPLPAIVRDIQHTALATAARRDVKLVFQMGSGIFEGVANLDQVQAGVRYFLLAMIENAPAGSTVSFNGSQSVHGLSLSASASEALGFDEANVFARKLPDDPNENNATISMTLATMLLDLGPSDISMFSRGSLHTVIADYKP